MLRAGSRVSVFGYMLIMDLHYNYIHSVIGGIDELSKKDQVSFVFF